MKKICVAIIVILVGLNSCRVKEWPYIQTDEPVPSLNTRLRILVDNDPKITVGRSTNEYILPYRSFKQLVENFLEKTGFEIVDSNSTNYNLTLKIMIKATPISGFYAKNTYTVGDPSYEGAEISGTFYFLDSTDQKVGNTSFKGRRELPEKAGGMRKNPSEAPFELALKNSNFFSLLGGVIQKKYGNDVAAFYWCSFFQFADSLIYDRDVIIEEDLVKHSIDTLKEFSNIRVIKPLFKYARHFEITPIADAIAKIGSPAVDPLITILKLNQNKKYKSEFPNTYKTKESTDYFNEWETTAYNESFAACCLGKIKDRRAIEPLLKSLKSGLPKVRFWSAFALFSLGEVSQADKALKEFTAENLVVDSRIWADWWKKNESRFH